VATILLLSGCAARRAGDAESSSGASSSTSVAGAVPQPSGPSVPATTGSSSGTAPTGTDLATAPGAPAPWSALPAVDPIGQTIDGSMVTPDGRTRTWHLYVPTTLPSGEAVPLLVGLHGGTGWGRQFQRSSGFDGIAEANGFLVVFPDGIGVGPTETLRTWNGGGCCGPAMRDDVDDVGFISMLIDQVASEYPIDPARTYAAGHSNGAVLSIRLACELADQIVAVGFQAGSMEIDSCDPAQPVSMLHLHGLADENVPIEGGVGKGISATDWNPVLDGLRKIAAAQGCPEPTTVNDPDQPELQIQRWSPCEDDTTIEYVLVPGANHAWMGADGGELSPSGTPFAGFDSTEAIWAFLAAHPRSL
jgi:polyhydroxybutyrate depolymerase